MLSIAVAASLILAVAALGSVAWWVRQGAYQVQAVTVALEAFASALTGPRTGTDPELIERLDSLERRMEALAADAQKWYRKAAQERRRVEAATGIDDDDVPATPAALDQLRGALGAGNGPGPHGRPRLRRPQRRR